MSKLVSLLCVFLICAGSPLYAETLNIAVHEFCPYLCDAEKEDGKEGFVVEIIRGIYEPAGYTVQFHRVPYVRGIKSTEQGLYDGMPMLNPQSSQELLLSQERIAILLQNFYVKKGDSWKYTGVVSLENIIVGNIVGYNYSPIDQAYEAYLEMHRDDSDRVDTVGGVDAVLKNLRKIQAGRIQTFNECSFVVDYLSMKFAMTGEFDASGTLGVLNNYMGFSQKHPRAKALVDLYDKGIKTLRASGQLEQILAKYGLEDWERR